MQTLESPSAQQEAYQHMYEEFGTEKSEMLFGVKFIPTYRIGLTNYLREEWIFKMLPIGTNDVVADIGCASGRQAFRAAAMAKHVIGTDIAQSFIDYAIKKQNQAGIHNTKFITCPIEHLAIESHSVDRVICSEVIEHVLDLDASLNELKRILTPGGKLLITVPNMNADGTLLGRFLRLVGVRAFHPMTTFSKEALLSHGDSHVREFTIRTLSSTLEQHGFRPIAHTTVSMIDGYDRAINLLLRASWIRRCIVGTEHILSRMRLPFGRHIVMLCENT